MVYHRDEPEQGAVHEIPLITLHADHLTAYESLRHAHPLPPSNPSAPRKPLSLHQESIAPPTDAECGLPDLLTDTLSAIPRAHRPLASYLSRPAIAVLHGYTRRELAVSLAHALNLRRAAARARAVLVVASSEAAVREWVTCLCQILDEVQLISYSRGRKKRDATLLRLRDTNFPGVVVAAEKTAREGAPELWQALRENRLVKKWEIVVSEAVSDSSVESVCSPLRMVRDGTAEAGVVLGKKALSRAKAADVVRAVHGIDMDAFWFRKKDVERVVADREKPEKSPVRKGRPSAEGKENRASLRNRDVADACEGRTKPPQGPVIMRRRSKSADIARKPRASKAQHLGKHEASKAGSPVVQRRSKSPIVKPTKAKEFGPRAKPARIPLVPSRRRSISDDVENLISATDSSTDLRRSTRNPVKKTSEERSKPVKEQVERTGRATSGPIKRRRPWIAPEIMSRLPGQRRRSPRFSPPPSSDEFSLALTSNTQPKQRRSRDSDSAKERIAVPPLNATKRPHSKSRGSSSGSAIISRTEITNDDDNTTASRRTKERIRKRARALDIYDSESSDETFYTPPSHPLPPPSPEFHTPRTSFSPTELQGPSRARKSAVVRIASRKVSSERSREQEPAKKRSASVPKSASKRDVRLPNSPPLKIPGPRRKNNRLSFFGNADSSDDEPLAAKLADIRRPAERGRSMISPPLARGAKRTAVQTSPKSASKRIGRLANSVPLKVPGPRQKNKRLSFFDNADSSDDVPLAAKLADIRRPAERGRSMISTPLARSGRRTAVQTSPATPIRKDTTKRTSVFDGLQSPNFPCSQEGNRGRRHTISGPVRVKHEIDIAGRAHDVRGASRATSIEASRRKETAKQRSVFDGLQSPSLPSSQRGNRARRPRSYSGPVHVKYEDHLVIRAHNTVDAARASRARAARLPARSPVRTTSPVARPVRSEVIIILSDTEEDAEREAAAKKRRLVANAEPRRATRRNHAEAGPTGRRTQGQNRTGPSDRSHIRRSNSFRDTNVSQEGSLGSLPRRGSRRHHTEAGTSGRRTQGRSRTGPVDRSQTRRSSSFRDINVSQEDNLGSFIRGVTRSRKRNGLTEAQRDRYDDLVTEAQQYERIGRHREAIERYEKCMDIYDGDEKLTNRFLALSSKYGYLRPDDFSRRPARSPIKKQSSRRRNAGRTARDDRSISRAEVIDLTSS